jgi:hypothetical protein
MLVENLADWIEDKLPNLRTEGDDIPKISE